jgi:hypothetical protein
MIMSDESMPKSCHYCRKKTVCKAYGSAFSACAEDIDVLFAATRDMRLPNCPLKELITCSECYRWSTTDLSGQSHMCNNWGCYTDPEFYCRDAFKR